MIFTGFLDATVLVPPRLRDTLCCIAEYESFRPRWSSSVLGEVAASSPRGDDVRRGLRSWFPEAEVVVNDIVDHLAQGLEGPGRRTVAAALVGAADVIVTTDWQRYVDSVGDQLTIQHPDEFLMHQLSLDPGLVQEALSYEVGERHMAPTSIDALLHELAPHTPQFTAAAAIEWRL